MGAIAGPTIERRRAAGAMIALALLIAPGAARADDPPAPPVVSADPPAPPAASADPPAPPVARADPPPHPRRYDLGFAPFLGGNSDVGLGIGQLSSVTRLGPTPRTYRWRLDTGTALAFKHRPRGLIIPIQDYYLKLTIPQLRPRLRLEARIAYTDEEGVHFPGFGNASPRPTRDRPHEDYEFRRLHPNALVELRYRVHGPWHLGVGDSLTYDRLRVEPTSLLAETRATGGEVERRLLARGFGAHAVELLDLSVLYDTRDRETSTRRGQFHAAKLRLSPHLGGALPYGYARVTLTARGYVSPTPRLTLAARVMADGLFGDPPFYELARVEEYAAIGGANAVRGVPAGRLYGKAKLFGNVEARVDLWRFCVRGRPNGLGVAAFVDAGRTWTEVGRVHPELDGRGLGLHVGVGGGLRWRQGDNFVVRADVAWSPDAHPLGAYFTAGEIF